VVDVAPQGTTLDEGGAVAEVDRDGTHRRKIDDDAVVAYRRAGNAVPSTSYGDLEVAVSGEAHRGGDVRGAVAAGDQSWSTVDHAVPDGPSDVVVMMVGSDELPPEAWDLHGGRCCHRASSGRWVHRNTGAHSGEGSYLDSEGRNLDFTAVATRRTLPS
jgi:hypothetical protein